MPKVLNRKDVSNPPNSVYIGRPSKWANPFIIGKDGTREEVIEKYKNWLLETEWTTGLILDIGELRGKDLVCWCSPLPCHGDILLELANK